MDIFTMGLVVCYTLTGYHPFDEVSEEQSLVQCFRQANIARGEKPSYLDIALDQIRELSMSVVTGGLYTSSIFNIV